MKGIKNDKDEIKYKILRTEMNHLEPYHEIEMKYTGETKIFLVGTWVWYSKKEFVLEGFKKHWEIRRGINEGY